MNDILASALAAAIPAALGGALLALVSWVLSRRKSPESGTGVEDTQSQTRSRRLSGWTRLWVIAALVIWTVGGLFAYDFWTRGPRGIVTDAGQICAAYSVSPLAANGDDINGMRNSYSLCMRDEIVFAAADLQSNGPARRHRAATIRVAQFIGAGPFAILLLFFATKWIRRGFVRPA